MQETANKQKRISLKTVHQMLDGMSVELAEKVHLLFMANYIDYSDYDFRDEDQVESYCWCYRDLFELKTKASQEIVNSQLIEFLDEWRQDVPSRYRKAKDDVCYGNRGTRPGGSYRGWRTSCENARMYLDMEFRLLTRLHSGHRL